MEGSLAVPCDLVVYRVFRNGLIPFQKPGMVQGISQSHDLSETLWPIKPSMVLLA